MKESKKSSPVPRAKKAKVTRIWIEDYPATFVFSTVAKLKPFKYGCKQRGAILLRALYRKGIKSPCHAYEDYIVESVRVSAKNEETWFLGS
jgi:hypothetical protein